MHTGHRNTPGLGLLPEEVKRETRFHVWIDLAHKQARNSATTTRFSGPKNSIHSFNTDPKTPPMPTLSCLIVKRRIASTQNPSELLRFVHSQWVPPTDSPLAIPRIHPKHFKRIHHQLTPKMLPTPSLQQPQRPQATATHTGHCASRIHSPTSFP